MRVEVCENFARFLIVNTAKTTTRRKIFESNRFLRRIINKVNYCGDEF